MAKHYLYDIVREPTMGHALDDLLNNTGLNTTWGWSGSHSFSTKEEYEQITWLDKTASDEDKQIDPWTGEPKHKKTYEQVKNIVPSWEDVLAYHNNNLQEYEAYAGKRARQYPKIEDQLDMLYKDIHAGILGEEAKNSTFYKTILDVKTSNS